VNSKLSATSSIGKNTDDSISSPSFRIILINCYTWKTVQVFSPERDKIHKFWESCHKFVLAHHNLVKPMELQRIHIKLPKNEILHSKVHIFQSYIRCKLDLQNNFKIRVLKRYAKFELA
jgi:hypothetical protein